MLSTHTHTHTHTHTGGGNKDKVKLQDVQAITLEQGKMVNARRVSAIPQVSAGLVLVNS